MKRKWLFILCVFMTLAAAAGGYATDHDAALIRAATDGDLAGVNAALNAGADVNAKDTTYAEATPLMWAAQNGHTEIVKLLCEWGADTNVRMKVDGVEYSALKLARHMETKDIVGILESVGAEE